ncbi:MAG: VPLPA-CTERM sorting domain-containing protein [Rhodobacteraceae bacterium]|jgi:hypothetical protein|nr:VPLPA-CTERM sorting domain-containing protein [Paracoccaceae bacterium]
MKKAIYGATAAIALFAAGAASAATVTQTTFASNQYAAAKTFEANFLSSLGGLQVTTENFDSLALQTANSINTSVGTFTSTQAGQLGMTVRTLDAATTPFSGRRDMTSADNSGQWLDSNDSEKVVWTIMFTQTIKALGFFMTDVNDIDASMTAQFANGATEVFNLSFSGVGGTAPNGQISYITALFDSGVTSVTFHVDKPNDGWGIDDVSVAEVPLPAPALMLLGGLGALAAVRRKRKSA